jgi:hypothetical protein
MKGMDTMLARQLTGHPSKSSFALKVEAIADNEHKKLVLGNEYDGSLHWRMPMWADSLRDPS